MLAISILHPLQKPYFREDYSSDEKPESCIAASSTIDDLMDICNSHLRIDQNAGWAKAQGFNEFCQKNWETMLSTGVDDQEDRFHGWIDRVELGSAFILVEFWLSDRQATDVNPFIHVGGIRKNTRWTKIVRSDIPSLANSFRAILPRSELDGASNMFAIGANDQWGVLVPEQQVISPGRPRGALDHFDGNYLNGWVDTSNVDLGAAVSAELFIDNKELISIVCNVPRSDVVDAKLTLCPNTGFKIHRAEIINAIIANGLDSHASGGNEIEIEMRWGTHILDSKLITIDNHVRGFLERFSEGTLYGWAIRSLPTGQPVDLELLINGVRYNTFQANIWREDLKSIAAVYDGGGFAIPLRFVPADETHFEVRVLSLPSRKPLDGSVLLTRNEMASASLFVEPMPQRLIDGDANSGVVIIVPVYNAPDELEICLESLLQHTTVSARLIVIDDASPDPAISELLGRYRRIDNLDIVRNQTNLGFTATANLGIRLAGKADVVLLNSGTRVTPRWLEGLRRAAYSAADIGTATAVSDNAGAFSIPEIDRYNERPAGLDHDTYARLITQLSIGLRPRVPTGNGHCLYMRRDCLDAIGELDEKAFPRGYGKENDFCMRALRAGWSHVIDDRTLIYHKQSASYGEEGRHTSCASASLIIDERYPEYRKLIRVYSEGPEMLAMRYVARRIVARPSADVSGKPRILYVISTLEGGTPQTNQDLMSALQGDYDAWLLYCDSSNIELSHIMLESSKLVARHSLRVQIDAVSHRSKEYDDVVSKWLCRYVFEIVHIRHIAYHSLGLINRCGRLGIPIVFSFHDFYTVCPTIKLLDENFHYCGGNCTPSSGDCVADLWPPESFPPLKGRWVRRWREIMAEVLHECSAFVTTAASSHAVLTSNFPFLKDRDFRVIPHGRSFDAMRKFARVPNLLEPVRILVAGNIDKPKGAGRILSLRDRDVLGRLEFHILGNSIEDLKGPRIICHGPYKREEFAARAASINAHLGAVLSIWPETYCHTLTELWSIGLPVLAFDFGAVAERIRIAGGGWIIPHHDADVAFDAIISIISDNDSYREKAANIDRWQESEGRMNDVQFMAAQYKNLYADIVDSRRILRTPPPLPMSASGYQTLNRGMSVRK
ncbi:glycosyltransferase [Methylocapsa sp. D3K7]|uniref:glycosyltransferase n=1 Tax=Methylocapsa sp. D3K7 TaxID=3041435 RepID=UPI00244E81BC|nr:glycosyltransferase [Methylocapsa sp. D3K7]WGJ14339.1 glycosyltransferase [Methylocapsa sp. D3K7]